MWRLILFLLLLIVSVFIGVAVSRHPGYLLLTYSHVMVQMPLWFVVIGIVVVFFVFYLLINSFDHLQFLFFRIKNWWHSRQSQHIYTRTQKGLAMLVEGDWKKAEKLFIRASSNVPDPLIHYLSAAKAAQAQGALSRRDDYIKLAYQKVPQAEMAIGLTQAELEMEQQQYEHAKATLTHLRDLQPKHARVLKLLEMIYVRTADWEALQSLLPALKKAKLINAEEKAQFEKNIYSEWLDTHPAMTIAELRSSWEKVPRSLSKQPTVIYAYVKQLMRFTEGHQEAGDLIRHTLKKHYHDGLAHLYGQLPLANPNRQLQIVNGWVQRHGEHPALLLLLATCCANLQLWGRAKDYFAKVLSFGPNREASLHYGQLLLQLGENEEALQAYEAGLRTLA